MQQQQSDAAPAVWPIPDPKVIAETLRARRVETFDNTSQDVIDYAAGLIDADGKMQTDIISVSQAQKGVACLHFLYDNFGGQVVALSHNDNANHQQAYEWQIFSDSLRNFARRIVGSLLLKKREAIAVIDYEALPKLAKSKAREHIKSLKHIPHDPVPESVKPSDAYFGGFVDGEIKFDTHGKSSQHHTFDQSHRAICDVFERRFGGTTCWSASNNTFVWSIHTFARKFLESVAPYIVGKKAQVDLILNMKPGEAMKIHAELRKLKGNIGMETPKIDKYLAGNSREFVNPPKQLPMGVHECKGKFQAIIKHNKKQYNLGIHDTIAAASAQYDEYKYLVEAEKRGGPKVDLNFNTRERKKNREPPEGQVLPKGIHMTKSNTYQVRGARNGGKPTQLGTYKNLVDAESALVRFRARSQATLVGACTKPEPNSEVCLLNAHIARVCLDRLKFLLENGLHS